MTTRSITCAVDGVNCAGCISKIERHLNALDGVIMARGNATLKRLKVVWEEGTQSETTLFKAIENLGFEPKTIDLATEIAPERSLLPHLGVAGFCTMNIMGFSFSVWAGLLTDMGPATLQFMHWLSAALALPVVLYSGSVFTAPAFKALKKGRMTMDTPISLAIWVTFIASLFETMRGSEHVYFDAVASLIFLLLIGRVLEQSLKKRSGAASTNLRQMMQVMATKETAGGPVTLNASNLVNGDIITVNAGERIPADARLLSKYAETDESIVTGETLPRALHEGDALIAGAILTQGPARMEVTHVGEDAQIGKITQLVADMEAHKGNLQHLADRFAATYIPLVLGGGAFGFLLWYFLLGATFGDALMIAVAVLVVTCPCAAGLATPAVTSRASQLLLNAGIIVKSGDALERLGDVEKVVADKTGTLSIPTLTPSNSVPENILKEASGLAANSHHPLAKSLRNAYPDTPAQEVTEHIGQGLENKDGARLGSAGFAGSKDPQNTPSLWYKQADQTYQIRFEEHPREGLKPLQCDLEILQIPLFLLSGDQPASVEIFAKANGISDWLGGQNPQEKLEYLQKDTSRTLMFGDGINDAPALSAAHVSASLAGASEIAQVAADVVLTRPDLSLLSSAIKLSQNARTLILQNLYFSTAYNVTTVPLALAGYLTPAIAALLMSSSSILVLANGFRLRPLK